MITNLPMLMQSIPRLLGIFSLLFCCVFFASAEPEWQEHEATGGVSLFTRDTPSGYDEVKVITQVDADYKAILMLLDDLKAAPHWIAHCRKVESLGWFGAYERKVHSFFASPWPLSDRDMVIYSKATVNELEHSLVIDVADKGKDQQTLSHYVRMENVKGTWNSKSLGNGKTEISYVGYGEPAGVVPAWFANRLLKDSSLETFINMKKLITRKQYQTTDISQITE